MCIRDRAGIPLLFIVFIVIAVVIIFIMGRTGFGRKIYMIGENHTAARFSAVNNEKSIIIIYAMAGFCAGVAGLMIGARVNSVKCGYGDTYLLQAILVAVLAGISPSGGKGKVVGILLALVSGSLLIDNQRYILIFIVYPLIIMCGVDVYKRQILDTELTVTTGGIMPVSYYGGAKLASEALISSYTSMCDMNVVIFRCRDY